MANKNLNQAKSAKNDEFYTQLADIASELKHYRQHFAGKTVFCNCDDPYESNFFKYFALNFNSLGLKKLIATCYDGSPVADTQMSLFESDEPNGKQQKTRVPHKIVITEVTDVNGDGATDLTDVEWLIKNDKNVLTTLKGNGDFRSPECLELLKEADIVVTNPPFSLFREYVAKLIESKKSFLIIGNQNNVTYKDIFSLLRSNEIWLGYNSGPMSFAIPSVYDETKTNITINNDGLILSKMGNICWYTNLDHNKRHEEIDLYKSYSPTMYPKFDNYDAILVKKVSEIPIDYDGAMGVPPTFFANYNPNQFEILGITDRDNNSGLKTKIYNKQEYPNASDLNRRGVIKEGNKMKLCWPTILIRKKQ